MLRRAIELFNTQGYDATSMGDLARELGLTKSAIYHHVSGKEALLSAALDEALDGLQTALDEAADLQGAIEAAVHVLVDHLPAVTLLLRVRGNSEVELAALRRRRALDERLASLVRSGVAAGGVRDDLDADVIGRLIFGTVNSLVEWYRPGGPLEAHELARSVTALVFDGLRRP